ncbi:MAG: hypothetical protein JXR37_01720 [Kiritimatiellae bacterium]|nr:hypothetical protein [Kiritimatiellia bacterium]
MSRSPRPGSRLKNAGQFLTATTRAGSGTAVEVADVYWFTDGMDMVEGDEIVVGANAPVKIVSITYPADPEATTAGILEVDRRVEWQAGDHVHVCYGGWESRLAPSIGLLD